MNSPHITQLIPIERVEKLIHLARGEKVLLDAETHHQLSTINSQPSTCRQPSGEWIERFEECTVRT